MLLKHDDIPGIHQTEAAHPQSLRCGGAGISSRLASLTVAQVVDSGQNAFMTPDEHREYLSTFHTLVEEACCFYRAIFPADPALATCVYGGAPGQRRRMSPC
jgi:hypothetical protein